MLGPMRAVWLTKTGGPEVLVPGDAPDPVAGPGQVLIEVAFSNVTFVETAGRAGRFSPFKIEPPVILGSGVGGVIVAVGPGVPADRIGARVVAGLPGLGGHAELVAVDAAQPVDVPEGLALDHATALLIDGRTAVMLMEAAEVRKGERVLVEAAAGGVGTLLVQLAKLAGAQVVAVAGGGPKVAVAREMGADLAIDYLAPNWAERVGGPVDVVFDGVGGAVGRTAFELLGRGGRLMTYGLASGEWTGISPETAAERGVAVIRPQPSPERMRGMMITSLTEAAAGRLRPVIGQRFPLEQLAAAHAAIESRATVGRSLLIVR